MDVRIPHPVLLWCDVKEEKNVPNLRHWFHSFMMKALVEL